MHINVELIKEASWFKKLVRQEGLRKIFSIMKRYLSWSEAQPRPEKTLELKFQDDQAVLSFGRRWISLYPFAFLVLI